MGYAIFRLLFSLVIAAIAWLLVVFAALTFFMCKAEGIPFRAPELVVISLGGLVVFRWLYKAIQDTAGERQAMRTGRRLSRVGQNWLQQRR
jgi:TRAP-type C4-dicarboxylate transport system permease small subunit